MHEQEQNLPALAESFTQKRNLIRVECLQNMLPFRVGTQKLLNFLGGESVGLVHERLREFPLILGGGEIKNLGVNLRQCIRPVLLQKFGNTSYLKNDGEAIWDESETLVNEMGEEQATLQKAYWQDASVLLGDHLGLLRMNVLSYELLSERSGSINTVLEDQIKLDTSKRLDSIQQEIQATPAWLARKGLPEEGELVKSKSVLEKRIERELLESERSRVEELIGRGVHPKIAEARILTEINQPQELTPDNIAVVEGQLELLRKIHPQLIAEYERLQPVLSVVTNELINKNELVHIMQARKLAFGK